MSHNIVPHTMRARHFETGDWETLVLDTTALFWMRNAFVCYGPEEQDGDRGHVNLDEYDAFEGVAA